MGVTTTARVHDHEETGSGRRFLVDRLSARGVRRAELEGLAARRAPSAELRRWFAHEPARWHDFRRRYFDELDQHPEAWRPLCQAVAAGDVTLLYSARDAEHNNAVALRDYLVARLEQDETSRGQGPDPRGRHR